MSFVVEVCVDCDDVDTFYVLFCCGVLVCPDTCGVLVVVEC